MLLFFGQFSQLSKRGIIIFVSKRMFIKKHIYCSYKIPLYPTKSFGILYHRINCCNKIICVKKIARIRLL